MNGAGKGLTLIGASAGSGKTHCLTQVVTEAIDPEGAAPVRVEQLFAVTYTRKGAAELDARIRRRLAESGEFERAQNLPMACVGTVHAVCLRLVKEFAVDAGISPRVEAMPGDETRFLREVLERGLPPNLKSRVERLAQSLEIRADPKRRRVDWVTPVQDIMTLARSNRISPEALLEMGKRSAAGLLRIVGAAEPSGVALEAELVGALERAEAELARAPGTVKKTATALEEVRSALRKARRGQLEWSDWVRLGKVEPAVAVDSAVAPLREVARRVDVHPRLQAELEDFTVAAFEAARFGLEAYDDWKKRRRIVDFVDMVDRALTLLDHPGVRAEIASRYKLLVVDEFQDTSPVQLALFMRLHELGGCSTWVGDRKQCIFEYAGADPVLMEAVMTWARRSEGQVKQLPRNWRSRPELVAFFSKLFTAALERHGYRPEELIMEAQRSTADGLAKLPPLGLWWLDAKSKDGDAEAIASGVARLLATPEETPIADRATGEVRALRGGDVAVLVATNAEATAVANALAARGVMAAIARAGLFGTPEGVLSRAALRLLVDPRDSLSRAEIELLVGLEACTPDAWLERLIAETDAYRAAIDSGEEPPEPVSSREGTILERIRREMNALSPGEVLDEVLASMDVLTLAARWPDPSQRAGNVDALRALTRTYEERCLKHGETATVAGLLRFFDDASEEVLIRDEELASDDQHVRLGAHAVSVTTYHKAKGLEWPVVILGSLNRPPRRDAFEVSPENDEAQFDATDPLRGRWIRYFPQPYGVQRVSPLADRVAASPEEDARSRRARSGSGFGSCMSASRAPAII